MPNKCSDCPSFYTAEQAEHTFGRNPGAPMCQKFGYILGKPGMSPHQLAAVHKFFASDYQGGCDEYGKPSPATVPVSMATQVTRPDVDILQHGPTTQQEQQVVRTCAGCVNLVNEDVVFAELGWSLPLCRATGKLLFPSQYASEARGCSYRRPGAHIDTTSGLSLKPYYEEMFAQTGPVAAFVARLGEPVIDPNDYESDADLSPEDVAAGVRAWRKVGEGDLGTPGEGDPIFLPIMAESVYAADELARIPRTGDAEHPEWYVDHAELVKAVAVSWMQDETPSLEGEPGTGKTELMRHIAWLCGMPFEPVKIMPESTVEDVLGKVLIEEKNGAPVTVPVYGRLTKAFMRPFVVVADEWNSNDDIRFALRGMTDNSKEMVCDWWDGRVIKRHPFGIFGLASNPSYDFRNVGVKAMAAADGDRLDTILIELPPENVERAILTKACEIDGWTPAPELLDQIMNIARDIRALAANGSIPVTWNIRPQKQVIRKSRYVNLLSCYLRAVGNRLEPDARQLIIDAVKSHIA